MVPHILERNIQMSTDNIEQEHFDVAIIDADSIIYQIAYTQKSPALCQKEMDSKIDSIMGQTNARSGVIFIKGKGNFRFKVDPEYKSHRVDKIEPDVKERIDSLYEYTRTFAMEAVDGEADDYCAITARMAVTEGKSYIISHIDKDLNCIPGWHHNFRTGTLYQSNRAECYAWVMQQLLTGDSTDNIKGLVKVGPVTAKKILDGVAHSNMLALVLDTWQSRQGSEWEENFIKCANNIYLREYSDDLCPLNLKELKERLAWKTTDIGLLYQTDQKEPLDSSTLFSAQQEDNTSEESNS
jgi:5'-3' exonuclease